MPLRRVIVFIDYQNVYKGAREAFDWTNQPGSFGQIDPLLLGQHLISQYPDRVLTQVRVYRGRPSQKRDPRGYAANQRQLAVWNQTTDVKPVLRDLRYPPGWPNCPEKPQEKGVDVALAVDFVRLAIHDRYDIGVVFSADTDLRPALESVLELDNAPKVEVAGWKPDGRYGSRLRLPNHKAIWCHWLDEQQHQTVSDPANYGK